MNEASSILLVTRKWAPAMGGMETWSINVAKALGEKVDTPVIALPGRSDGMPPSAIALMLFPINVISQYLRMDHKPSSILLGDMAIWPIGILLRLCGFGGVLLIAAHGTDTSYHRRGGVKGSLYGCYQRLGSRLMRKTKVFANSHATADVLKETGWIASKVIPLATKIPVKHSAKSDVRDGIKLLFAGRLIKLKGCGWFVENVLKLLPTSTEIKIAGTGWDAAEAWIIEHPQVQYLGLLNRQNLDLEYAAADCVIIPNVETPQGEFEGFGLVALEAAAAGGLVLAADHGGLRDAVINGLTGFHLPSEDAAAWAQKIIDIRDWDSARRRDFIAKSRETIAAQFNWNVVAQRIVELSQPTA